LTSIDNNIESNAAIRASLPVHLRNDVRKVVDAFQANLLTVLEKRRREKQRIEDMDTSIKDNARLRSSTLSGSSCFDYTKAQPSSHNSGKLIPKAYSSNPWRNESPSYPAKTNWKTCPKSINRADVGPILKIESRS
jgi:hypothetical protein